MSTALTVENLNYYYQDGETKRVILKDINIEFQYGTFYTILGESGSGKTTLLSLLAALDESQEGSIVFEGMEIDHIGQEAYRRNHAGIVFQNFNLIPYMTAVENLLVAMDGTENELPKNNKETAYNLLKYLGVDQEKADRLVTKLSGGESQRVAIARALSTEVNLIFADEPTGNLDEEREEEIVEIFKMLAHKHNKCIIVVTHSKEVASQSDVMLVLRKGELKVHE